MNYIHQVNHPGDDRTSPTSTVETPSLSTNPLASPNNPSIKEALDAQQLRWKTTGQMQQLKGIFSTYQKARYEAEKDARLHDAVELFYSIFSTCSSSSIIIAEAENGEGRKSISGDNIKIASRYTLSSFGSLLETFPDAPAFAYQVARRFVKEARKRAMKLSRENGATAIMHFIAPHKGDGWKYLCTLTILTKCSSALVDNVVQASLPSTLVKCIHIFIDLPVDVLPAPGSAELIEFWSLAHFLLKHVHAALELVSSKDLRLLFRIATIYCPPHNLAWRDGALDMLKLIFSSSLTLDMVKFVHSNACLNINIQCLKQFTLSKECVPSEVIKMCQTLCCCIRESGKFSNVLMDDFRKFGGYEWLGDYLLILSDNKDDKHLNMLLSIIVDMVFCGQVVVHPPTMKNVPFLDTTFSVPAPTNLTFNVRNESAFLVLQNSFLCSRSSMLQEALLSSILNVFSLDAANFFILEPLHTLAHFLERIESLHDDIKKLLFKIVEFVVCSLNFIPFPALISLSIQLKGSPSSSTLTIALEMISKFISFDERYQDVFREVGMLDIFSDIICSYANDGIGEVVRTSYTEKAQSRIFTLLMDCVAVMVNGNDDNIMVLRKSPTYDALFTMVLCDDMRHESLYIVLKLATSTDNGCTVSDLTALFSCLQSGISKGNAEAVVNGCGMCYDVLRTIQRIIHFDHARDIFREAGGFVVITSLFVSLEGTFSKDVRNNELESSIATTGNKLVLLRALFQTLSISMAGHSINTFYFSEQVGFNTLTESLLLLGILNTPNSADLFDNLLLFATDDFPRRSSSYLRTSREELESVAELRTPSVVHPVAVRVAIRLLCNESDSVVIHNVLSRVLELVEQSAPNRQRLADTGIVTQLLDCQVDCPLVHDLIEYIGRLKLSPLEFRRIVLSLEDDDVACYVRNEDKETSLARIIRMAQNEQPSYVELDMRDKGHACVLMASVEDRLWPPVACTIILWIFIEQLGDDHPIRLLTIKDSARTISCVSISSNGTSLTLSSISTGGSEAFFHCGFSPGRWYHVSLAVSKHRLRGNTATLYVDGAFIETVRFSFLHGSTTNSGISMYVGTSFADRKVSSLIWRLGSWYVVDDLLSASTIKSMFSLGPRFLGNFTNSATLRTHSIALDASSTSLIAEERFMMAFHAYNASCAQAATGGNDFSTLFGENASYCGTTVVLNSAPAFASNIPRILSSSVPTSLPCMCAARILGDAEALKPSGVSAAVRSVGGIAVPLRIVLDSVSPKALANAVSVLVTVILSDPHLALEMENQCGYQILAMLLRNKGHLLSDIIVDSLLFLVGVYVETSGGSLGPAVTRDGENIIPIAVLANISACKYLFLDVAVWYDAGDSIQRRIFSDVIPVLLAPDNPHHVFNSQRLRKIHAVSKLVFVLRDPHVSSSVHMVVVDVLGDVLRHQIIDADLRRIGDFVLTMIEPPPNYYDVNSVDYCSMLPCGWEVNRSTELREYMLQMLVSVIQCIDAEMRVPDKILNLLGEDWILNFFGQHISECTVTLAMRLLASLCADDRRGSAFLAKFRNSARGFLVLRNVLPCFCNNFDIYISLVAILFGRDMSNVPTSDDVDLGRIDVLLELESCSAISTNGAEAIYVILAMARQLHHVDIYDKLIVASCTESSPLQSRPVLDSSVHQVAVISLLRVLSIRIADSAELLRRPTVIDGLVDLAFRVAEVDEDVVVNDSTLNAYSVDDAENVISLDPFQKNKPTMQFRRCQSSESLLSVQCSSAPVTTLGSPCSTSLGSPVAESSSFMFSASPTRLLDNISLFSNAEDSNNSTASPKKQTRMLSMRMPKMSLRRNRAANADVSVVARGVGQRWKSEDDLSAAYASSEARRHLDIRKNSVLSDNSSVLGTALSMPAPRSRLYAFVPSTAAIGLLNEIVVDALQSGTTTTCVTSCLDMLIEASPPCIASEQATFQATMMQSVMIWILNQDTLSRMFLENSKLLGAITRLAHFLVDNLHQNRFPSESTYIVSEFVETILDVFTRTVQSRNRTSTEGLRDALSRIYLFQLNLSNTTPNILTRILDAIIKRHDILLDHLSIDSEFFAGLCHHLHLFILNDNSNLRDRSLELWKLLLLRKTSIMMRMLRSRAKSGEVIDIYSDGFVMLLQDEQRFQFWIADNDNLVRSVIKETATKTWQIACVTEHRAQAESDGQKYAKRVGRLAKRLRLARNGADNLHRVTTLLGERLLVLHRIEAAHALQLAENRADSVKFVVSKWEDMCAEVSCEQALWGPSVTSPLEKWMLDLTEGPSRMRKKMIRNPFFYSNYPCHVSLPASNDTNQLLKNRLNDRRPTSLDSQEYYRIHAAKDTVLTPSSKNHSLDTVPMPNDDITISVASFLDHSTSGGTRTNVISTLPLSTSDKHSDEAISGINNFDEMDDDDTSKDVKIMQLLEPGDSILYMVNCARVRGLDTREGLLIIGSTNIYVVDNYAITISNDIVDLLQNPQLHCESVVPRIDTYASSTATATTMEDHKCLSWAYVDIREVHRRRYLLREIAIELFSSDGRNVMLAFCKDFRENVYSRLITSVNDVAAASLRNSISDTTVNSGRGSNNGNFLHTFLPLGSMIGNSTRSVTQRWVKGDINNFEYLTYLNKSAGRSYNDLTQYPVFPWVLANYDVEFLDLTSPATFRDFSKPMGAQTESRAAEFRKRYDSWEDPSGDDPAFHYGTHYSSAAIVASYLIRLEPFSQAFLKLQGGQWDLPDRLFYSIPEAWLSASRNNSADVKELVPEFFYLPEFLLNSNRFNLGIKQTGERIDDVRLPRWAHGSAREFIRLHREALESDYVSAHLHEWIDLIFGYKQRGELAVESLNVFHHLSYEGAVDLDSIEDPVQRNATVGIINNFGQTPKQIFKRPHPQRIVGSGSRGDDVGTLDTRNSFNTEIFSENSADIANVPALLIYSSPEVMLPSYSPVKTIRNSVGYIDVVEEKVVCIGKKKALMSSSQTRCLTWGNLDHMLHLCAVESSGCGRMLSCYDRSHVGIVTCGIFVDDRMLLTGSDDTTICVWHVECSGSHCTLAPRKFLYGHLDEVSCIAASRNYSIAVSGSKDGTCIVWDLNRLCYVHQLTNHAGPVCCVTINNISGDIISSSGTHLYVWTVNGQILTSAVTALNESSTIISLVVSEGSEWDQNNIIVTGHRSGIIRIWSLVYASARERRLFSSFNSKNPVMRLSLSGCDMPAIPSFDSTGWTYSLKLRTELSQQMRLKDTTWCPTSKASQEDNENTPSMPTALHISHDQRALYVGDDGGSVFRWSLPDTLGGKADHWIKDDAVDSCFNCHSKFTFAERRHHCRNCGQVYCSKCSNFETAIPRLRIQKKVRVCIDCYDFVTSSSQ